MNEISRRVPEIGPAYQASGPDPLLQGLMEALSHGLFEFY